MAMQLNATHDPAARSWLASAQATGGDFPVQNLPLAVLRRSGSDEPFRGGVAIGDQAVDMAALAASGLLSGAAQAAASLAAAATLNDLMAAGPAAWSALRRGLFALLEAGASAAQQATARATLLPINAVEFRLPTDIGDYTDFYTSIHHARNVGRIARPDDPLTANFQWLPIAYHGRASSVVISGTPFVRPQGQAMPPGAASPIFGPCQRLDFELELGVFVGPGNPLGVPIPLQHADDHIFGICLLNDWSARDIQFWEMAPLGPFLGKNFCTSLSPWIVTAEALAPYRLPFTRPANEPQPLTYLDHADNRAHGVLDIQLEVHIQTRRHRDAGQAGTLITATSFRHQYWTIAQMLTQHTVGGCNLQPGDLVGTGTISGPTPAEAGAIIELTRGGREPLTLDNGEQRAFLHDGDCVILSGHCERPGAARIGFGECRGMVLPSLSEPECTRPP